MKKEHGKEITQSTQIPSMTTNGGIKVEGQEEISTLRCMYCDAECSSALEDEHRRAFWFVSGCYHDNHTFAAVMGAGDWSTVKF